jgi:WD40 repeat protein/serine/threonine protein kinase
MLPALVLMEEAKSGDDTSSQRRQAKVWAAAAPLRQLGDYQILREVGRGGMGVVYEAQQLSLGRHVAIKVLPSHALMDARKLGRFRREARSAARLHHTNIVPVFGVGEQDGLHYYVMQFIPGLGLDEVLEELQRLRPGKPGSASTLGSTGDKVRVARKDISSTELAQALTTGRFTPAGTKDGDTQPARSDATATAAPPVETPIAGRLSDAFSLSSSSVVLPGSGRQSGKKRLTYWQSVARIGVQVADALEYAHRQGIQHRDIKPSNLLLDTTGTVWVTDFGLAKADDQQDLTRTGDVLGTLRYMPPEAFDGRADARGDVYSLGLTLYELLALRPAFDEKERSRLVKRVTTEEPVRLDRLNREVPRDLVTIVHKASDRDPAHRYASAADLAADLQRFIDDEPIQARRVSAAERYFRWARRNPLIASLGGVLTGVLVLATVGSLLAAQLFRTQALTQRLLAEDRERQRQEAVQARSEEAAARHAADQVNARLRDAQEEMRQAEYTTRSNFALAAWDANDVGRLRSLLDLMRPAPGEPDRRGWEWRYLWQLGHEERLTLRADDPAPFGDVAFSPDGQTIAGLLSKGRIQLWDRHNGESRRTMGVTSEDRTSYLGGGVHAVAFSPDGRSLAGPGPDASLVLYDVATGLPTLRFEGDPGAVLKLVWGPDGRTLIASISAHVMRVWDARDGHLIHRNFGQHEGPVAAVAFSPDDQTLVSASYDRTVKLWNLDDPVRPRAVLRGHTNEVRAVAFSPDGKRLCSAGLDGAIRVWDARSGAVLAVIWGHAGAVTSLAYLPDGARVVTGSADQTVRVWDTATGQELRRFKGQTGGVVAVAVSPDGRDIASASDLGDINAANDVAVRVWSADNPLRPRTLRSPSVLTYGGNVECLALSPDGRRLVSGHNDKALRVWDLVSDRPPRVLKGHEKPVKCVAFSPDGRTIASGSADHTVRLWDADTGQSRLRFTGHTGELRGLIFTPDGQTVLSCGHDRTIQAWDPATGLVRSVLRGHSETVHDLALSPDGRTLASASYDKTCILWDFPAGQPRLTLRRHTGGVNSVAFGPGGRTVATASEDGTVRLWNASDGSLQGLLKGHSAEVIGLAFNPDGRLASSGSDNTIRLWDPASGQALLILKGHAGRVRCVKFSPDGRTLASASYDRTIKLWEAASLDALSAGP